MRIIVVILLLAANQTVFSQLVWRERASTSQIELYHQSRLISSFCYSDSLEKPILFPVNSRSGITVTRGFPLAPRVGERTDHPHHTGVWLNYESVNGIDYWNHSKAISPGKKDHYGSVVVFGKPVATSSGNEARVLYDAHWISNSGDTVLLERTTYRFRMMDASVVITRQTTLEAWDSAVVFRDVKDGFFAIRVARELELPGDVPDNFIDAQGNVTRMQKVDNTNVTGDYLNSEGLRGDDVWGKRSNWVMMSGVKEKTDISLLMFDHESNPGYPAYYHARGYGLFAINPLGVNIFSGGKEQLNLTLSRGQKTTFTFYLVIHEGKLSASQASSLYSSIKRFQGN